LLVLPTLGQETTMRPPSTIKARSKTKSDTTQMAAALFRAAVPPKELPAETTQARRFGKTRTAQSAALLEDYVELIADLLATSGEARPTDVARRFGVSHATAIKTIARIKREGFATARPYRGVFLTESGHALADRVRARHRLVVDVLVAIGVPREAAESDAEGIEHYVSEATLAAFEDFLRAQKLPDDPKSS
jgi:DtxR family manganese transport transcriptional regulator